jgi:hypothetical protein
MGVFMGPEAQPSSIESHGIILPKNSISFPVSSNSLNTADGYETWLSEANRDMSIPSPPDIPNHLTICNPHHFPVTGEGRLAVTLPGNAVNSKTSVAGEGKIRDEEDGSRTLRFDAEVFACSASSIKDREYLRSISQMIEILSAGRLIMSEFQFTQHFQGVFNKNLKSVLSLDIDKERTSEKRREITIRRRRHLEEAGNIILKNDESWFAHWLKITNIYFGSLAQKIEDTESLEMRNILILYLFY